MTQNLIEGMTRSELRAMIREVLIEVLQELGGQSEDTDEGLAFRPEIAARLRAFMSQPTVGQPVEDVARELGLDV